MKAKIDEIGNLHIQRAGELKKQYCPYSSTDSRDNVATCGDRCPLFVECGPATVSDCYDQVDGHRRRPSDKYLPAPPSFAGENQKTGGDQRPGHHGFLTGKTAQRQQKSCRHQCACSAGAVVMQRGQPGGFRAVAAGRAGP